MSANAARSMIRRFWLLALIGVGIGSAAYVGWNRFQVTPLALAVGQDKADAKSGGRDNRQKAPELDGGIAWLNTAGPLKLADLKGKVVVLDFWTFCCINCIHTLPDLARLEKKYEKELVVVGVHSAKFENEKVTENIRKAVLRYQIQHSVVNDAEMKIWDRFGVQSWPTLAVIDPEGFYLGQVSGEGNFELLDEVIQKLIKKHTESKTLDAAPRRFDTAKFRDKVDSPLFFPGKVLADGPSNRLFIADSTNHRIVITDTAGKKLAVAGTGEPGFKDGPFATAQFDDPQGMALDGETLFVADRKNHLIRALDLKSGTVRKVAGVGRQVRENRGAGGPALETGLNSPWDLLLIGRTLFIAMAGHHQIWTLDIDKGKLDPYAGNGRENIRDGDLGASEFAQPSGLATDGQRLYVADSEVSAIRSVSLDKAGDVSTLVGLGLFKFGDVDGEGKDVRLQHALGVTHHAGKLFVADTYNSKLKVLDPATKRCTTFLGGGSGSDRLFNEPAGLSIANGKLYVADTNAHRIRVVDLGTKQVSTLPIQGVEPVGK